MSIEREKWNTEHLPDGYPKKCDTGQLNDVIQDLSAEYYQKTQSGKYNKIWESQIINLIKFGQDELTQRIRVDKKDVGKTKGVYLRVGGDIINDGIISAAEVVDIGVAGRYKSKKGKIMQGRELVSENRSRKRLSMDNPIVWIIASLILIMLVAAIWYWTDKAGFPLKFGSN